MSPQILRTLKIAFVHNYYIHYRLPLFKKLSQIFNMKFFFDDIHRYVDFVSKDLQYKVNIGPKLRGVKIPLSLWLHLFVYNPSVIIAGDAALPSTIVAFMFAKILRKPFILWEERWFWKNSIVGCFLWPMARFIALKSNILVLPGFLSKEFYRSIGVDEGKIVIAPNAIHVKVDYYENYKVEIEELRKKLELYQKIVILYLGRIVPYKGLHLLLKAVERLVGEGHNEIQLLIVGEEENRKYASIIKNYIEAKKLSDNVRMIGFVKEFEKYLFYELADIIVFPPYYEVWGFVINEAMQFAKPVISTRTCASACELIKDGYNGFLISPGDVDHLYYVLKKLLIDKDLRKVFGERSQQIINRYSCNAMLRNFLEAILLALRTSF